MIQDLPSVLTLHQLAEARARSVEPRVLVFGDTPPDATSRGRAYLIVDPDAGWDEVARADGTVSARRGRFRVRCCGSGVSQASLALDAARGAFLNWWPYEDPRFGMCRETEAGPLIEDKSVTTDVRYSFSLTYEIDD